MTNMKQSRQGGGDQYMGQLRMFILRFGSSFFVSRLALEGLEGQGQQYASSMSHIAEPDL